ncbi:MAG: helix-turn-helix domain-containing protein [Luteitalea sp.]|nr:helix-turn-helix domain-containing protein [Luteitalea sp.]
MVPKPITETVRSSVIANLRSITGVPRNTSACRARSDDCKHVRTRKKHGNAGTLASDKASDSQLKERDVNTQDLASATTNDAGAAPGPRGLWEGPRPRIGLRVDLRTTAPGVVELKALPEHRIKVHAGPPVRGTCQFDRFLYTRGDVDIVPAGVSDVWHEEDSNTSIVLEVTPSLLRRTAEDIGIDPDHAGLEPRHQVRDPQIEHLAWALEAERAAGYPGGLIYAESLGSALAIHLLGRYPAPLTSNGGLSRPQLRRVTAYIEEYLDQDLSLKRLADVVGVSPSHLKTLFKRSSGLPVHEYVVQRRVERAKWLLLRGDRPASQVAVETGFAHQSHMARCMRRILGATPASLMHAGRQVSRWRP